MRSRAAGWALLLSLIVMTALQAFGGALQLDSVPASSFSPPAGGGGDSFAPLLSPDGRYVLFASTANNLVLNNNPAPVALQFPPQLNVFLRDRTNQTTMLVSVNLAGTGGGNGDSLPTGLSADGRYALFESSADNLVPGDTNHVADVFLRDLVTSTTILVSVNTNGVAANGASRGSTFTPDGRYVAFASEASDLVPADTNGIPVVFVRDLQAGATSLVSVGAQANGGAGGSESPVLTPDGRYVAFYSGATNLVPGLTNSGDIYVRDLVGQTTTWASSYARTARQQLVSWFPGAVSCDPVLSADGQYVAYQANPIPLGSPFSVGVVLRYSLFTGSTDIIHTNAFVRTGPPEDVHCLDMTPDGRFVAFLARTNGGKVPSSCVCVWDAQTGQTVLASGDPTGSVSTSASCGPPSLDSSGRFVLFLSNGSNLVNNARAGDYHLYLRDLAANTTTLVSVDTNGFGPGLNAASLPRLTPDARYVAWECLDSELVPNERNHTYNVFVRDLVAGTNDLVSVRHPSLPSLSANGPSLLGSGSVSSDGTCMVFSSEADNLVPGDTNGYQDVFLLNLLTGTNCLVSVGTNGVGADGPSTEAAISADGRYVVFSSSADNLVAGDSNKAQDVFVRDLQTGTTVLVSTNSTWLGSGDRASYSPVISSDGRFVLFRSLAGNLTSESFYPGYENLFLRDLQRSTTYALTWNSSREGVGGVMTPDGRFVAFASSTSETANLSLWDSIAAKVVYSSTVSIFSWSFTFNNLGVSPNANLIALMTNSTVALIDRGAGTSWTVGRASPISHPGLRFSGDGRWLTYVGPLTGTNQVYLYDVQYRTNFLVSHTYGSAGGGNGPSDWPEISSDGRFVAYRSLAGDLVPGGASGTPQLFLFDHANNSTTLLSAGQMGLTPGDNRSLAPVFSPDAQTLLFASWASDLAPQDFNQSSDLFAYRLVASGEIPVFALTILSAGQAPVLSWPVLSGRTYQVQFKNSLNDSTWQPLNQAVTIIGSQGYLKDVSAGGGARFYRIVAY